MEWTAPRDRAGWKAASRSSESFTPEPSDGGCSPDLKRIGKNGQGLDGKQTGLYSSTMSRKREPSEARRRILETADRLFYQDGIRAVGIDRIVAEAEVAKMRDRKSTRLNSSH